MKKFTLIASLLAASALCGPVRAEPESAAPKAEQHRRLTWQQHFANANVTRDGHLTLEQAKTGYPSLAKHFPEIDADGKGYVTEDDVKAWHQAQRAKSPPAERKVHAKHAMHYGTDTPRTVKASVSMTIPLPTGTHMVGPDAPPVVHDGVGHG